jgi:hypothetical protein
MSSQAQLVSTQKTNRVSPPLAEIIAKSKNDLVVLAGKGNPEREKVHAVVCQQMGKMQALCLEAVKQHFSIKEALIHQENESKTASVSHQALRQSLEQRVAILKGSLAKDSKELEQVIALYKNLEAQKAALLATLTRLHMQGRLL